MPRPSRVDVCLLLARVEYSVRSGEIQAAYSVLTTHYHLLVRRMDCGFDLGDVGVRIDNANRIATLQPVSDSASARETNRRESGVAG